MDLSWRARLAGYRVVHVPRAVVFHDKRIDLDHYVVPATTEIRSSTLARLLLATRYGRPDVVEETIAFVRAAGGDDHRRALAEYRAQAAAGRLPAPLEDAASVAEFVGPHYATHRF
ncbi:MAG: hypothetical protein M5U14_13820 [Acidimicrobiia bacterium]|nr:hypothetical protein [Acidimicrobiia bacterium]